MLAGGGEEKTAPNTIEEPEPELLLKIVDLS
jgi:hypothetical protein